MRHHIAALLSHVLAAATAWFGPVADSLAAQQRRPPNIVHIVADDVAWDDLSCYGASDIATPNLDALATAGVRLLSFYAPHSTCTPTRAALLTGCYAQRVSLPAVLFPGSAVGLADDEITIAELLRDRGYATALIGKWHLGDSREFLPTRHGFETFFGIPYPNDHGPERLDANGTSRGFPPLPLIRGEDVVEQPAQLASLPDRFTAECVAWIESHKEQPFYLQYANIETHTPWLVGRTHQYHSKAGVYGDAVQCLDWSVGEIVAAIRRAGLERDTLVVFQSDNGPLVHAYPELERIYGHAATVDTTRTHRLREGKYQSRFEGGCRVAAIACWPGVLPAGTTDDALIAGFDWYATFAAAAGAELPTDREIDGADVLPWLARDADAAPPREDLFFFEGNRLVAARWRQWKLVLSTGDGAARLFDLAADANEANDVASAHGDVVATIERRCDAARADLGDERTGVAPAHRRAAGKRR